MLFISLGGKFNFKYLKCTFSFMTIVNVINQPSSRQHSVYNDAVTKGILVCCPLCMFEGFFYNMTNLQPPKLHFFLTFSQYNISLKGDTIFMVV